MKDTFYSYKRLYKNTIFSIVIRTLIIGGSLAWNIYNKLNDTHGIQPERKREQTLIKINPSACGQPHTAAYMFLPMKKPRQTPI